MKTWANPTKLQVLGRYIAFAGIVAAMVPICIPYVVVATWRSLTRKP